MLAKLTCRLSAQNHLHASRQRRLSEGGVINTCLLFKPTDVPVKGKLVTWQTPKAA